MVLRLLGMYPQACKLVCMVLLLLGVYPHACMLVCMVLLLYGLHSQTAPLRGGPEQRDGGVLED
jgi:hypothetical protein